VLQDPDLNYVSAGSFAADPAKPTGPFMSEVPPTPTMDAAVALCHKRRAIRYRAPCNARVFSARTIAPERIMTFARRTLLHLATGVAALPLL